jgi:hypothetical protein
MKMTASTQLRIACVVAALTAVGWFAMSTTRAQTQQNQQDRPVVSSQVPWTPQAAGAAGVSPPAGIVFPNHGTPVRIHSGLRRGDVIARGNPKAPRPDTPDDDCTFDFGIDISLVSGSRTVGLVKGQGCTMLLDRIEDRDVVERTIAAVITPPIGLTARLWRLLEPIWNQIEPVVHAASGPKRIQPYVWMDGWGSYYVGGDPYTDILTVVKAFSDFSWDGTNVWTNAGYSYCQPHVSTGWRLDYCYILENYYSGNSSTGPISRRDEGQFEWLCPNGPCYQHRLDNRRVGYWDGGTSCQAWYSGSIVYSTWSRCDVFDTPPCGTGGICFDPVFNIS